MSKLKQLFPNHKLGFKHDYELQQFTANDMIEFADTVSKEALRNASGHFDANWNKGAILNENNIPKI